MQKILASTGAFIGRPNGRDFNLIPVLAPMIEADGYELMFYDDWYSKVGEVTRTLSRSGLSFPTLHCEKRIGELLAEERTEEALSRFCINCEAAEAVGARLLVLHLWNGLISDSNIAANFAAHPLLAEEAARRGLTLTVENVIANGSGALALWRRLLETSPEALFTYDTKMAQFDLENGAAFEPENIGLWRNVRHLHINDRAGAYRDWNSIRALNIGCGDVDFEAFFGNLAKVGYAGDYTVEATAFREDGTIDFAGLNRSLEEVRKLARKVAVA